MSQANTNWGKRPTTQKSTEATAISEIDKLVTGKGGGKTARINVEVDEDLRARFKAKCAVDKREMKDVLTQLIEKFMNE